MRRRPYTPGGLSRVPCAHCGAVSSEQWNLRPCAIGERRWYGLCLPCDIELNATVLAFMREPKGAVLMADYRERKAA